MYMKRSMNNRLGLLLLAATLVAGCAKEENSSPVDPCKGQLAIGLSADATVETRAGENTIDLTSAVNNLKQPKVSECNISLTGKNITKLKVDENGELKTESTGGTFTNTWGPGDYDKPGLDPGDYTVVLSYGDPEAIGYNTPYYKGEATAKVVAGAEVTATVPLTIRNSAIRVQASDEFKAYFPDSKTSLILNGTEHPEWYFMIGHKEVIFVPEGTQIGLKVTGTRPSQNGTDAGSVMEWPYSNSGTLKGGTLYTFKLHANAGTATVTVTMEGYGETIEVGPNGGIETNPDAEKDK